MVKSMTLLNISEDELMEMVAKLLNVFKQIMAWLGILVLPEEEELPKQPETTEAEG